MEAETNIDSSSNVTMDWILLWEVAQDLKLNIYHISY